MWVMAFRKAKINSHYLKPAEYVIILLSQERVVKELKGSIY